MDNSPALAKHDTAMTVQTSDDDAPVRSGLPQTRWSVVLRAQADDPGALAALCRACWCPVACCAGRLTACPGDAEGRTQGCFATLLGRQGFKTVAAERGKLRSFLLGGLKNCAAEQYRRETRQKRGGGCAVI